MSSKFNSARSPQQTPKVCKKGMIPFGPGHELWPLKTLTVFTAWRTTDPNYPFLLVNTFTIRETIYPNTWQGFSATAGTRFMVGLVQLDQPNFFEITLALYYDDSPIQSVLWNLIPVDVARPFDSRLLERGEPEVHGIAALMITE